MYIRSKLCTIVIKSYCKSSRKGETQGTERGYQGPYTHVYHTYLLSGWMDGWMGGWCASVGTFRIVGPFDRLFVRLVSSLAKPKLRVHLYISSLLLR